MLVVAFFSCNVTPLRTLKYRHDSVVEQNHPGSDRVDPLLMELVAFLRLRVCSDSRSILQVSVPSDLFLGLLQGK